MESIVRGVFAGFAGTLVMSVVMLVLKRAGMEPGKLEPREVTCNAEEKIGVRSLLSPRARGELDNPAFHGARSLRHDDGGGVPDARR